MAQSSAQATKHSHITEQNSHNETHHKQRMQPVAALVSSVGDVKFLFDVSLACGCSVTSFGNADVVAFVSALRTPR